VDLHGADGNVSGEADEAAARTNPRMHPRQSRRRCTCFVVVVNPLTALQEARGGGLVVLTL